MIGVACWFVSHHTNPCSLLFVVSLLEQTLACTTCCKNTCWKTSIFGKARYIIHPSIIRPSVPPSLPPSVFPSLSSTLPPALQPSLRTSLRPPAPTPFPPSLRPSLWPPFYPSFPPSLPVSLLHSSLRFSLPPSLPPSVPPSLRPSIRPLSSIHSLTHFFPSRNIKTPLSWYFISGFFKLCLTKPCSIGVKGILVLLKWQTLRCL